MTTNHEKGIEMIVDGMSNSDMTDYIKAQNIPCPSCGGHDFTEIRKFNLMFKTFQGVTEDSKNEIYLRPETAQGIFVNFKNVQRTTRKKIPFGIGQIGKSFRNEITPGNFTFRTREFEQMELEFFCEPGTDLEWFAYWKEYCKNWLLSLGMKPESIKSGIIPEELSTTAMPPPILNSVPLRLGELWGIADRTDFDLKQHMIHARKTSPTLIPTRMKSMCPIASSLLLAPTCGIGVPV
jgi:glycyl-tRNA synthetase